MTKSIQSFDPQLFLEKPLICFYQQLIFLTFCWSSHNSSCFFGHWYPNREALQTARYVLVIADL